MGILFSHAQNGLYQEEMVIQRGQGGAGRPWRPAEKQGVVHFCWKDGQTRQVVVYVVACMCQWSAGQDVARIGPWCFSR